MINVLIVPTTPLGHEGITNVIFNQIQSIKRNDLSFGFILSFEASDWVRNKIYSLGGRIFDLPSRNKHPIQYILKLKEVILYNHYQVIHVHGNSATMAIDIFAAKYAGAPIRIAHSHNSMNKHKLIHRILKPLLNRNITHALACSKIAGEWAFNENFTVIKNGIDVEKFQFNQTIRDKYRHILGLEDNFVIGHIGHMSYQKNHQFLIRVFEHIYSINKNAKLLLVGDGPKRSQIEKQIIDLGLSNAVIMLGKRNDVNYILQAMDVFVLPSHYEGLGIVNIEAQASGLKCVAADTVPEEAKVSNNISFLSLNDQVETWAKEINKFSKGYIRNSLHKEISLQGYDIHDVANKLEGIYS